MHTPKMYVLNRLDLSPRYRSVQAGHALSKYSLEQPEIFREWNNHSLIYVAVQNLIELREWVEKLQNKGMIFSVFTEPDLDDQPTAIACYNGSGIFHGLRLVE